MGEIRQILKKKRFYLFSKVILAVSKVRHLPHLPPLRFGHVKHMLKYPSLHLESKSTRDKERNQQTMSQMSNGFENKKVWIA
jgi:hypothetical protein